MDRKSIEDDDDDWDEAGGPGDDDDEGDLFQTMDDTPVMVIKGIYIGSFMAEHNKEACKEAGITHILQVIRDEGTALPISMMAPSRTLRFLGNTRR